MRIEELKNKILEFNVKARCTYTQRKAGQIWREIEDKLERGARFKLSVAWSHFLIGESAEELDHVTHEIIGALV